MTKWALILTALLAGCAAPGPGREARAMAEAGQPPAYVQGYDDGCTTGKSLAWGGSNHPKDMRRYGTERLYTVGWDDGKERCRAYADSVNPYKR